MAWVKGDFQIALPFAEEWMFFGKDIGHFPVFNINSNLWYMHWIRNIYGSFYFHYWKNEAIWTGNLSFNFCHAEGTLTRTHSQAGTTSLPTKRVNAAQSEQEQVWMLLGTGQKAGLTSVFLLKNGLLPWCTSVFPVKNLHHPTHLGLDCVVSPPCTASSAGNLWQTSLKASIITACLSHLNYSLESNTSLPGPLKGLSVSHRTAPAPPRDSAAHPTHLKNLSAPKVSERSQPLRWLSVLSHNPAHFIQIPPLSPLENSHKRGL